MSAADSPRRREIDSMKRTSLRRAEPRGPNVRAARRGDRAAISALWADVDRLHASLHPTYFRGDGRLDSRLADAIERVAETRELLVAERDGTVVGFVLVEMLEPSRLGRGQRNRRGHIDALIVAPGARRSGCGRRLMEAACNWARVRRAEELLLTVWAGNDGATRFYESLGLERVSHVMRLAL
jgi:ribosomal protein S18 acetylase RimI-like enzyme